MKMLVLLGQSSEKAEVMAVTITVGIFVVVLFALRWLSYLQGKIDDKWWDFKETLRVRDRKVHLVRVSMGGEGPFLSILYPITYEAASSCCEEWHPIEVSEFKGFRKLAEAVVADKAPSWVRGNRNDWRALLEVN